MAQGPTVFPPQALRPNAGQAPQGLVGAEQLERAGDFVGAEKLVKAVLAKAPKDVRAIRLLARIKGQSGDRIGARRALEKCLKIEPNSAVARIDLAGLLYEGGAYDQALKHLNRVLASHPEHQAATVHKAEVLDRMGRLEEAADLLEAAVEKDPGLYPAWLALATILKHLARVEDALRAGRKALELQPGAIPALNNMATLLASTHDPKHRPDAIRLFQDVLRRVPTLKEAHGNLAALLFEQGDYAQAREHYLQAGNDHTRCRALECLMHLGEWDQYAAEAAEEAKQPRGSLNLPSLTAFAAERKGIPDPTRYCPNPFEIVKIYPNVAKDAPDPDWLHAMAEHLLTRDSVWEPLGSTTTKGYQTQVPLLNDPSGPVKELEATLRHAVDRFLEDNKDADCDLIKHWPSRYKLDVWFVNLTSGGHQLAHNHPYGWLSGVFYVGMPSDMTPPDGGIEFSLAGASYPDVAPEKARTMTHQPSLGDIALFPSSLFHRTIPFSSDQARLSVAFDVNRDD